MKYKIFKFFVKESFFSFIRTTYEVLRLILHRIKYIPYVCSLFHSVFFSPQFIKKVTFKKLYLQIIKNTKIITVGASKTQNCTIVN